MLLVPNICKRNGTLDEAEAESSCLFAFPIPHSGGFSCASSRLLGSVDVFHQASGISKRYDSYDIL